LSKILVLGSAGFVGFHVSSVLSSDPNNQITLVDNMQRGRMDDAFSSLINKPNVTFLQADITDDSVYSNLANDYEYIYNFAAVIGVQNVENNPDKVLYVNSISMLNLFEYAKTLNSLKRVIFTSTSEIYSGTLRHYGISIPTSEEVKLVVDDITSNRSTYALSKMFGESVAHVYGKKYSIPYTIVRYHNVYGPRMGYAHVIPETFIKINTNDLIEVPSSEHTRAFCYIDDAVRMTIGLAENMGTSGETYHVGNSKEEIKIKELVELVANTMSKVVGVEPLPPTKGSPERRAPSTKKITQATGIEPEVSLAEGLRLTYEWYQDKLDTRWE
jgi:UDP-glucose 4-epimerase